MTGKTHVMAGIGTSLLLFQPAKPSLMVLGMGASLIGSVISDIDVGTSDSHKESDKILLLMILAVTAVVFIERTWHFGLTEMILANRGLIKLLISLAVFFVVMVMGRISNHRSFMHSFLCMGILTMAVALISYDAAWYFGAGFFSHIFLDLLNHKGVKLFYPIKQGICLKACDSDGTVNKMIFLISSVVVMVTSAILVLKMTGVM